MRGRGRREEMLSGFRLEEYDCRVRGTIFDNPARSTGHAPCVLPVRHLNSGARYRLDKSLFAIAFPDKLAHTVAQA